MGFGFGRLAGRNAARVAGLAGLLALAAAASASAAERPKVAIVDVAEEKAAKGAVAGVGRDLEAFLVEDLASYRWVRSAEVARLLASAPAPDPAPAPDLAPPPVVDAAGERAAGEPAPPATPAAAPGVPPVVEPAAWNRSAGPAIEARQPADLYLAIAYRIDVGRWRFRVTGTRPGGEVAFRFVEEEHDVFSAARAFRRVADRLRTELPLAIGRDDELGALAGLARKPLDLLFGAGPTLDGDVDLNGAVTVRYGPDDVLSSGVGLYSTTIRFAEEAEGSIDGYDWTERQYRLVTRPIGYDLRLAGDTTAFGLALALENVTGYNRVRYQETLACASDEALCEGVELGPDELLYAVTHTRVWSTRADVLVGPSLRHGRLVVEALGRYTPVMYRSSEGETVASYPGAGTFSFDSVTLHAYGGELVADLGGLLFGADLYASADWSLETWGEFSPDGAHEGDGREERLRGKGGLGFPMLALGEVYPMLSLVYSRTDRFFTPLGGAEERDSVPSVLALSLDLRNR